MQANCSIITFSWSVLLYVSFYSFWIYKHTLLCLLSCHVLQQMQSNPFFYNAFNCLVLCWNLLKGVDSTVLSCILEDVLCGAGKLSGVSVPKFCPTYIEIVFFLTRYKYMNIVTLQAIILRTYIKNKTMYSCYRLKVRISSACNATIGTFFSISHKSPKHCGSAELNYWSTPLWK